MKKAASIAKKEREAIFGLFMTRTRMRFSEIERAVKIRSNMVSYHLSQMIKEGLLAKKNECYELTVAGEKLMPVFSHLISGSLGALPIVLVALTDKNKILLLKRDKRPYLGLWGLIGGKVLLEEGLFEAAKRICREKTRFDCKPLAVNAVVHERVVENGIVKHGFFLFMVSASAKIDAKLPSKNLAWFDLKRLGVEKIILSDLWLINTKLKSKISIKNVDLLDSNRDVLKCRFLD